MAEPKRLDQAYMKCALAMSELSHARRKKVGAILVSKNGHIIAEGYNGTPSGFDNTCEYFLSDCRHIWIEEEITNYLCCTKCGNKIDKRLMMQNSLPISSKLLVTKPEVLHAESNAISKVARSTNSSEGATLYITLSPCLECSKLIIQSGIKRVVFFETYKTDEGIEKLDGVVLLEKANIRVERIENV